MVKSKEHYFDVTTKLDFMEMKNAIEEVKKEVKNWFDFKGIDVEIDLNDKAKILSLSSSSDSKIDAFKNIVISKMIKRGLSPKSFDEVKKEGISRGNIKVIYKIVDTISKEETKK